MAERAQRSDGPAPGEPGPDGIVIYERLLPAVAGSVPRIRRELGAALVPCDLDARRLSDIALFVTEAASNAVRHAYVDEPGLVYALAGVDDGWLGLVISDWGSGLPSGDRVPGAVSKPAGAGLGLELMGRLADTMRVESDASGTDVEAAFELAGATAHSGPPAGGRDARGRMLREYLSALQETNDGLRHDTAAVIAEARQAVAHSRRRRRGRQGLH